jgi:hypothetical protein
MSKWFMTLPTKLPQEQPMKVHSLEGLRLSTLKQDGHGDLCGSGRWSIIPYIHEGIVVLLYVFFKLALNWLKWT